MSESQVLQVRCPIKLGQLLKLSGLIDNGAEAAEIIACGAVTVDDEPVAQRGRSLRGGETVVVRMPGGHVSLKVQATEAP